MTAHNSLKVPRSSAPLNFAGRWSLSLPAIHPLTRQMHAASFCTCAAASNGRKMTLLHIYYLLYSSLEISTQSLSSHHPKKRGDVDARFRVRTREASFLSLPRGPPPHKSTPARGAHSFGAQKVAKTHMQKKVWDALPSSPNKRLRSGL